MNVEMQRGIKIRIELFVVKQCDNNVVSSIGVKVDGNNE